MDSFGIPISLSDLQTHLNPLLRAVQGSALYHGIKPSNATDGLALIIFLLISLIYLTRGHVWDKPDAYYHVYFERPQTKEGETTGNVATTRDISQRLTEGQHQCVIFWGSQSGTSERFAETLGRECRANFGINALVADLSDFDVETIQHISKAYFAIFILSTYGEGDPSDNTSGLWDWIKSVNEGVIRLESLRYLAFGLGNSNYKYYNRVLDVVSDALDAAGATELLPRQRADDANGGTEEDFQSWKDDVFSLLCQMGYEQKCAGYQPRAEISFTGELYHGALKPSMSLNHQASSTNSPIVPLPIKSARELFGTGDRNCLHIELDLGSTELVYKTGDHIGIWPCNPDEEVDRLVAVLGVQSCREENFTITSRDAIKLKIPSPTTIDTTFRHHLEICGPVTRKTVLEIVEFAPTSEAKLMLSDLARDRTSYEQFTSNNHITLARLLQLASPTMPWTKLPLCFVFDCLRPLLPRYYSISSSSVISPRKVAVTALVVNNALPTTTIPGLTSNYLLSSSNLPVAAKFPKPTYSRLSDSDNRVFAHVRKSKFKLPLTSSTPLVLISAGTGFAPFRAFLLERAKLYSIGKPIGKILLFFGCRGQSDFIYREEIEKIQSQLGDRLEVVTAFSRATKHKVYVQDRVGDHAKKVLELLDSGANIYLCGQATMAREVDGILEDAASRMKGLSEVEIKAWADALKKRGKWKADVWG